MPRTCSICTDSRRRRIERSKSSESFASLARIYGVGTASLKRHFKNCVGSAVANPAPPSEAEGAADAVRFASEHDLSTPAGMIAYLQALALRAKPNEVAPLLSLAAKLNGSFEAPAVQPRDIDLEAALGLTRDDILALVAEGRARLNLPLPQPPRELPKPWEREAC